MQKQDTIKQAIEKVYQKILQMSDIELYCKMEETVCYGGLEYDLQYLNDHNFTWEKYMGQCMKWFKDMWE